MVEKSMLNIHERIEKLVNQFSNGNRTAFGKETNLLPGVLASIVGGRMSKPSFEMLEKIMLRFPEVSGDWLLTGQGDMLKKKPSAVVWQDASALPEIKVRTDLSDDLIRVFNNYLDVRNPLNTSYWKSLEGSYYDAKAELELEYFARKVSEKYGEEYRIPYNGKDFN